MAYIHVVEQFSLHSIAACILQMKNYDQRKLQIQFTQKSYESHILCGKLAKTFRFQFVASSALKENWFEVEIQWGKNINRKLQLKTSRYYNYVNETICEYEKLSIRLVRLENCFQLWVYHV